MLFEGEMMTMNYDMMESYTKLLAKQAKWTVLLEAKYRQIKYWRETKSVDHRSRRAFLEIICIQIISEDIYKLEQTLDNFCKEVGGNPYVHDEYEICVGIKEALEKKDWEQMQDWLKKPLLQFIEIEIVKALKVWVKDQPIA